MKTTNTVPHEGSDQPRPLSNAQQWNDDITKAGIAKMREHASPTNHAANAELSMTSLVTAETEWLARPPDAFDIVSCFYPETQPAPGGLILRPALVLSVQIAPSTGVFGAEVAYGSAHLNPIHKSGYDLLIRNPLDMATIGLDCPTRFVFEETITLPWLPSFFGCWEGYMSPKIGALTDEYALACRMLQIARSTSVRRQKWDTRV